MKEFIFRLRHNRLESPARSKARSAWLPAFLMSCNN
jgi:hypothetical protein